MTRKLVLVLLIALMSSGLIFSEAAVSTGIIHLGVNSSNAGKSNLSVNNLSSLQSNSNSIGHGKHGHGHSGHGVNEKKHKDEKTKRGVDVNLLSFLPNFKFQGYNSSLLRIGYFYIHGVNGSLEVNKTGSRLNISTTSLGWIVEGVPLKAKSLVVNYESNLTGSTGVFLKLMKSNDSNSTEYIVIPFYASHNVSPANSTLIKVFDMNVTVNSSPHSVTFYEYVSKDRVFFLPNETLYGKIKLSLVKFVNYSNISPDEKYLVGIFVSSDTMSSTHSSHTVTVLIKEWKLIGVHVHFKRDHYVVILKDGEVKIAGKEFYANNSVITLGGGKTLVIRSYNGTGYVTLRSDDVGFLFVAKNESNFGVEINSSNVSVFLLLHSTMNLANYSNVTVHLRLDGKMVAITFHESREGNTYYLVPVKEINYGVFQINAEQVLKELGLNESVNSVSIGEILQSQGIVTLKFFSSILS